MRGSSALYAGGAALAVLGLGFWIAPASPVSAPGSLRPNDPTEQPPAASSVVPSYDHIVTANIFSKQRVPPANRFAPAGSRRVSTPPARRAVAFTLYGTALGPEGSVALIRPDGGTPRLYRIGDSVGIAHVIAVTESTATLERPTGQVILHIGTATP